MIIHKDELLRQKESGKKRKPNKKQHEFMDEVNEKDTIFHLYSIYSTNNKKQEQILQFCVAELPEQKKTQNK